MRSMMGFGVPLMPHSAYQVVTSMLTPDSCSVGTSGSSSERLAVVTASARRQQYDGARRTQHQRLLVVAPAAYKAHATLAEIALAEGDPAEAVGHLERLLALQDDWWPAFERMGTALLRQGKTGEALSWFTRALSRKPDDADALFGRGVCLAEAGKLEEAVAAWSTVLAQEDQGHRAAQLHLNLARALDRLGRTREANQHRAALRRLEGRPRFGLAWLRDQVRGLFGR